MQTLRDIERICYENELARAERWEERFDDEEFDEDEEYDEEEDDEWQPGEHICQ